MELFDIPARILGTITLRPYFAAFLLTYFLACSFHLGVRRALYFAAAGYCVAWGFEYSSIHNGFPYGHYYYIPRTKEIELWVLGVPFMDSMSFVFLSYASFSMALFAVTPAVRNRGIYLLENRRIRHSLKVRFLGALFCVGLDVIIDPVALRGGRWFLGEIYGYTVKGAYFGIPVSNFIGWFIVAFCLIYLLQLIDRALAARGVRDIFGAKYLWRYLPGPALYVVIIVFNLSVTLFIGEYLLFAAGMLIVLLPAAALVMLLKAGVGDSAYREAVRAHLDDFPGTAIPALRESVRR